MATSIAAVLLALTAAARPAAGGEDLASRVAEGDALYERRAEGARGAVADPAMADRAVASYRRALAAHPGDLVVLSRLMRALNFRGAFCGADVEAQKRLFDEAKALGQAEVDRLEARMRGRDGAGRLAALRGVRGGAALYYWTAASWGQWALARGKFAAARAGVGGRVRTLAQTVVDLDPALEEGGGYRILGRLHDEAPRIPLITGWVSRTKAVEYLRKSLELGPRNPVTWFFLAEALLDHEPRSAEEARALLRRCIDTPPRPDYHVESLDYAERARARLAGLR